MARDGRGRRGALGRARTSDRPDGLALPGGSVTLISADGLVVTATTDEAGEYHLNVASGRYRLRAELRGFQPVLLPSIPVGTEPVVADVKLSLQSFTHQVRSALSRTCR